MLIASNTILYHLMPPYKIFRIILRTKPHTWLSDHRASRWAAEGWRESHFCVEGTDLDTKECEKRILDTKYHDIIRYHCDITRTLDITWHPVRAGNSRWVGSSWIHAMESLYLWWYQFRFSGRLSWVMHLYAVRCGFDSWYERLVATISPPGWRSCSLNEYCRMQIVNTNESEGYLKLTCRGQGRCWK